MADTGMQISGCPASFGEELLWSTAMDPKAAVAFLECPLHMSLVVRLEGRLNVAALQHAIREIVRRHRVLTSRFHREPQGLERMLDERARIEVAAVDLAGIGAPREHAGAILAEHIARSFDLTHGPLLRALVVRLSAEAHVLSVVVHHIVFDAGSRAVVLRELSAHYAAAAAGRPSALAELGPGYESYASWQRARLPPEREAALLAAWSARLDTAPDVRLPAERESASGRCGRVRFDLGAREVTTIRRVAREQRVTAAAVTLALFARFVQERCGSEDVVIGMPISDRRRRDFEDLIGLFANVLLVRPVRCTASSFTVLVRSVWQGLVAAIAEQDLPYARFLQLRSAAATPPFRIAFNYIHSAAEPALELPGLAAERLAMGQEPPCHVDLALLVADHGATLACEFMYPAERFSARRMDTESHAFRTLASDVLSAFEPPLHS